MENFVTFFTAMATFPYGKVTFNVLIFFIPKNTEKYSAFARRLNKAKTS